MTEQQDTDVGSWAEQVPPVLWPVPIAEAGSLVEEFDPIGCRVVVSHQPHTGRWVYQQRAFTRIHEYQGAPSIGVIPELDWYRQRRDPSYVAVPHPVPVERVFVELGMPMRGEQPVPPDQSELRPSARSASLVTDLDSPPVRWPRRANGQEFVTGARCWVIDSGGPRRDWRAVGEPRKSEVGTIDFTQGLDGLDQPTVSTMIPLLREPDWYQLIDTGGSQTDEVLLAESYLVFLE